MLQGLTRDTGRIERFLAKRDLLNPGIGNLSGSGYDPPGRPRLPLDAYLRTVAASNFKQRTRKMMEYYYADRYNYAVTGTPNRLEYDQGFLSRMATDRLTSSPLLISYKSQVY